jgi:ribosome-associated translation inhibitor RaiA
MKIHVKTDSKVDGGEALVARVEDVVKQMLRPFRYRISGVEVHLTEQSGDSDGLGDKRCVVVARVEGLHPTAVTHQASTLDQAVDGAVDKLRRNLESSLGRAEAVRY